MAEWIPWSQARSPAEGIKQVLIGETTMILCRFNSKINNNYSPKWRWVVVLLATDPKVNNCFRIYLNSEIIEHKNDGF